MDDAGMRIIRTSRPVEACEDMMADEFVDDSGAVKLWFWDDQFWRYDYNAHKWVTASDQTIRRQHIDWLSQAYVRHEEGQSRYHPRRKFISEMTSMLEAKAELDKPGLPPFWVDEVGQQEPCDANNVIAFKNGLFDISKWNPEEETPLMRHTPRWFSQHILPFDYDPDAECPTWDLFLDDVFNGNQYSIDSLMEWFGYCMTSDTRYQKFVIMHGPPRSGKGTICRVLRELVGHENVASPTLTSLTGNFGLEPLRNKQLAIIGDAHLDMGTALPVIETIKTISGEDAITVNRKHIKADPSEKLRVRFTISCNIMPNLPDPSGGLAARVLPFSFENSFMGKEDLDLTKKLLAEMQGIAIRSIEGLHRLRTTGRFTESETNDVVRKALGQHGSELNDFLMEYFVYTDDLTDPLFKIAVGDFACGYNLWRSRAGYKKMTQANIAARLLAVKPEVYNSKKRKAIGGHSQFCYIGLRLNERFVREFHRDITNAGMQYIPNYQNPANSGQQIPVMVWNAKGYHATLERSLGEEITGPDAGEGPAPF